jgi:hypothetical protein
MLPNFRGMGREGEPLIIPSEEVVWIDRCSERPLPVTTKQDSTFVASEKQEC